MEGLGFRVEGLSGLLGGPLRVRNEGSYRGLWISALAGFYEGSFMVEEGLYNRVSGGFQNGLQVGPATLRQNPINCTDQVGKECARIHGTCSYEVLVGGVLVRAYGLSF